LCILVKNKNFPTKGNKQFKALRMKASFSRKSKRTEHNKPGAPLKGAVNAALTFITTEIELLKANNQGKTIVNVVDAG